MIKMSEEIRKRIEKVKEERSKWLDKFKAYYTDYEVYISDLISFILNKEYPLREDAGRRKMRKQIKRENKLIKIKRKNFLENASAITCCWNEFRFRDRTMINLNAEMWNECRRILLLIEKHAEEYKILKAKEELVKITKCYKSLTGEDPCSKICEDCGRENPIDAKYCVECGKCFLSNLHVPDSKDKFKELPQPVFRQEWIDACTDSENTCADCIHLKGEGKLMNVLGKWKKTYSCKMNPYVLYSGIEIYNPKYRKTCKNFRKK